ncbi:sigma-54-dependent transcriptional regulator [Alkanindiges sp. WGS2144]|uniref:sigma-54-dependent transcriptional regulator n=1 Tax=Alkanindiges sp. WGS2144 TaxID=3366808 RepID=UPI0037521FF5
MMQNRPLALVVDDEEDLRLLMRMTLKRMNIDCYVADSLQQAQQLLKKNKFDVCLTDLNLPDGSGLELVHTIIQHYPQLPVAVITAYGSMDIAIEALKAGAFDFVSKPIEMPRLKNLIEQALKVNSQAQSVTNGIEHQKLLGNSPVMQQLKATLHKLARSQAPVYISGESGTGKEVAARLIHLLGPRSNGPFIPVNCGAIPSELMESEFFGHKKGSFTGATEDKVGLFQSAQGGTLFLDEVADLPLSMQVKLLRAIQEKKIRPIGTQQEISVDIRLLSATHKNLQHLVQQGLFRQDLYYRIHVIEVNMPPLRDRAQDILLLAGAFIEQICQEWGIEQPVLSKAAQQALLQYTFPGNVRELHNILERALTLSDGQEILPESLQLHGSGNSQPPVLTTQQLVPEPVYLSEQPAASTRPEPQKLNAQGLPSEGLEAYLEDIEKQLILQALESSYWNRTVAAKKLGMTFRSLRYRLKKFGLDSDQDDDDESR